MPKSPVVKVIKELKSFIRDRIINTRLADLKKMSRADLETKLGVPESSAVIEVIKADNDDVLMRILSSLDWLHDALREFDKNDKNTILHWCVLGNHVKTFNYLYHDGFFDHARQLNDYNLNPVQLAVILDSYVFIKQFQDDTSFSTSAIVFRDEQREYTSQFNDFHLAVIYGRYKIIQDSLEILKKRYMKPNLGLPHIGNVMHLFSYVALNIKPTNKKAMDNLKLSLKNVIEARLYQNTSEIADFLQDTYGNYERLTPIAVAAKYGQEAWVNVLSPYYEKAGLHHLVTEAKALLAVAKQEQASAPSSTGMFAGSAAAAAANPIAETSGFAPSSLMSSK